MSKLLPLILLSLVALVKSQYPTPPVITTVPPSISPTPPLITTGSPSTKPSVQTSGATGIQSNVTTTINSNFTSSINSTFSPPITTSASVSQCNPWSNGNSFCQTALGQDYVCSTCTSTCTLGTVAGTKCCGAGDCLNGACDWSEGNYTTGYCSASFCVPPNPVVMAYANCMSSPKCCYNGLTCFAKGSYYAMCMETCTPGINPNDPPDAQTPWSCNVLGTSIYSVGFDATVPPVYVFSPAASNSFTSNFCILLSVIVILVISMF